MRYMILLLCLILLGGCVTVPYSLEQRQEKEFRTFYLSVNSTPQDADIYINDRLVGRTPSSNVPLYVRYSRHVNPLWKCIAEVNEGYVIRVSKSGYKDVAEPIIFVSPVDSYKKGHNYQIPQRTEYHFNLEEIE